MSQPFDFKKAIIEVEKIVAEYVGNETEAMRQYGGNQLADELMASVACLFAARVCTMIHVWTGESVQNITTRMFETYDYNVKAQLQKFKEKVSAPHGEEKTSP